MNKIILTTMLILISQASQANNPIACGKEWINIHKGNPELVGIYVSQYPDNLEDKQVNEGKHPVAVYYLFSDHLMHAVTYTPSGQIQNGNWYSAEDNEWLYKKVTKEFKENVFCSFWVK